MQIVHVACDHVLYPFPDMGNSCHHSTYPWILLQIQWPCMPLGCCWNYWRK